MNPKSTTTLPRAERARQGAQARGDGQGILADVLNNAGSAERVAEERAGVQGRMRRRRENGRQLRNPFLQVAGRKGEQARLSLLRTPIATITARLGSDIGHYFTFLRFLQFAVFCLLLASLPMAMLSFSGGMLAHEGSGAGGVL
jgi:hypothetical protein